MNAPRTNVVARVSHARPVIVMEDQSANDASRGAAADFMSAIASAAINSHAQAQSAQVNAYIKLLQRMDWSFEMSDDQRVWRAGRDSLAELRMVQRELDPDFVVWNRYAPEAYRRNVAREVKV